MLPIRWVSRDEMLSDYVAKFKNLKGSDKGLPDSEIEGHHKYIMNVFGFNPPGGADAVNPVGDDTPAAIRPKAGFSVGYTRAKPHNGPVLHNHNTNETFIPIEGTWRFTWESSPAHSEYVDLGPLDAISFPPGVPRRFENLVPAADSEEGLMMAIVADDDPISEAMPGVKEMLMEINKGELPMLKTGPEHHKGPEANKANHQLSDNANMDADKDEKSVLLTSKQGGFGG